MLNNASSSAPSSHLPSDAAPPAATSIKKSISNLPLRTLSIASFRREVAAEQAGSDEDRRQCPAQETSVVRPSRNPTSHNDARGDREDQFAALTERAAVVVLALAVIVTFMVAGRTRHDDVVVVQQSPQRGLVDLVAVELDADQSGRYFGFDDSGHSAERLGNGAGLAHIASRQSPSTARDGTDRSTLRPLPRRGSGSSPRWSPTGRSAGTAAPEHRRRHRRHGPLRARVPRSAWWSADSRTGHARRAHPAATPAGRAPASRS